MNLPVISETNAVPLRSMRPEAMAETAEIPISPRYLLSMLHRRRGLFALVVSLSVAGAIAWTAALPKVYRASADVVLITRPAEMVPVPDMEAPAAPPRAEEVDTQIELVRSRDMAEQVLTRTGLLHDPAFRADVIEPHSVRRTVSTWLDRSKDGHPAVSGQSGELREKAVAYLLDRLTAYRVDNSFNLRIGFGDTDPFRATRVANAYARLFTTDDARIRARSNAIAARVLATRVDELRQAANRAFAAVQSYRVRNGLLSATATGLTEQEISAYNQQIAIAKAEAAQDAAALSSARIQLRTGGFDNVGEAVNSPAVSALRGQHAQLVVRERELSQRYFDDNPDLVTVRRQIADVDRQTAAEVGRSMRAMETRSRASAERLGSLLASRNGARGQLGTDNEAMVVLADLEKRAEAAQTLYRSYLDRYNQVSAGSGAEQPAARLISAATRPTIPESPDFWLNIALGLTIGLLAGALSAIASEMSYRGLTTMEDVEARLRICSLGFVPACRSIQPHSGSPLATLRDHPGGGFSESIRNVIVSIRQASPPSGRTSSRKVATIIAVTSALPGEGKSTIAACLGRTLAQAGEHVAVIDCDAMRGQLSRLFGMTESRPDLYEALRGQAERAPDYPDTDSALRVIPITRRCEMGERLTEQGRLQRVVARLRGEFDVIVLDCPPILPIAEAREIVAMADHVVLLVHWRRTIDRVIRAAIRQLPPRTLRRTGAVLNQVDVRKQARFGGTDPASFYARYREYYA